MDEIERNAYKVHTRETVQTVKRVENNFCTRGETERIKRISEN